MIFGFIMLREAAAPLTGYAWFQETLAWAGRSLLLCVLVSAVLSVLVQSSGCVLVIGIGLASAGILGVEQFLAIHVGACLGSSLSLRLLSMHLRGQSRQVAVYQELINYLMAAIFLPLYLIEAHYGVPLIKAALVSIELPLPQVLALYCFLPDLIAGAFQLAFLGPLARQLERWYPATKMELLSRPRHIHDQALEDAAGALLLADREQRRLPEIFSHYLDSVRQGTALKPVRETANDVLTRMDEFLQDVAHRFPDQAVEDHVAILNRQRLFSGLSEQILEFCRLLHRMAPNTALEVWRMGLVEGIDTVLLVLNDMLNADDPWPLPADKLMRRPRGVDEQDAPRLPRRRIGAVRRRPHQRAADHQLRGACVRTAGATGTDLSGVLCRCRRRGEWPDPHGCWSRPGRNARQRPPGG